MHVITRSCVLFLWMHALTFVKSQDCTLEQFLNSRLYDSNFDTSDLEASYAAGKQLRVGCNVGYSGFFKLICVEGQWQSRGAKCQPRSCGHPGDAQFADFHLEKGEDFVFGSQVVYTCHKGYQMVSRTNFRRCMAEGWDGVVPVCEAQQCPVIHVADNVLVNGDPEEATYGNVVRFSCKSNNEILSGSSEIYCDENGEWSGQAPNCQAITCTVPDIEHGNVPGYIKEYKEHEILHFTCNPRYQSAEDRPSKCTKVGIRAEWSPTPVCQPIKCRLPLTALEGTRYEPAFRNVFSPGDTVRVICGEQHWISTQQDSSAEVTCNDDGQWSLRPVCQEVRCSNQRPPFVTYWEFYWGQRITLGETTSYRCRSGYRRTDGATRATCTRDGWRPNPLCQEITCDRLVIQNANIISTDRETYRYNERVNYDCHNGYRGSPTLICTDSGWSGNSQCTEITCNRQSIPNADIVNDKETYRYSEQAKYVCKDGYQGNLTRTCTENGWTGRSQCSEIMCRKLDIDNAYMTRDSKESYRHSEQVRYACTNDGERRFTVTCERGVWTGVQSCPVCPRAREVPHGFVVGPFSDKLYYTCDDGYKLFTKGWWGEAKCNDGVWSGLESVRCIGIRKCGEIPVIPNGEVTPQQDVYGPDEIVPITCKDGYRAQVGNLTCHEGKWHSHGLPLRTICTPVADTCRPPPKVENAVIPTPYQREYLSDSEVTYQCRDRFTMEGENTIRCVDGQWEKKNMMCTPPEQ